MTPNQIQAAQKLIAAAEIQSVRLVGARATFDARSEERQGLAGPPRQKGLEVNVKHSGNATLQSGTNVRALVRFGLDATEAGAKRPRRVFRLTASFELVYKVPSTPEPSPEELRAFSQTNAVFNAWPYWREFVQNMTARMNLPPLTLPLFRVAPGTSELKRPSQ